MKRTHFDLSEEDAFSGLAYMHCLLCCTESAAAAGRNANRQRGALYGPSSYSACRCIDAIWQALDAVILSMTLKGKTHFENPPKGSGFELARNKGLAFLSREILQSLKPGESKRRRLIFDI